MNGSLKIHTSLSHPAIPSSNYLDGSLHALLEIQPDFNMSSSSRPPLNIVLVVDASASMHHFQLTEEEREYWMGVAISRDELERGEADDSDAIYWTGQTLSEMQTLANTPMALATEAIKSLLMTLRPTDQVAVIAFADHTHTVFNQQDWANFPDGCLTQMDLLQERRLPVDIGTGTQMAEALSQALKFLSQHPLSHGINRLIVISDGIVQDQDATLKSIEQIEASEYAITTIGVGDEFDEEFLMRVADNSRGEYYYAGDITDITQRLSQVMTTLETTGVTDLYIAVRGLDGAVVQDIFLVRPAMTMFDEVHTEDGWLRARVGDVSSAAPVGVMVQIAPPLLPAGERAIVETLLTWNSLDETSVAVPGNDRSLITANFTDDSFALAETHPEVQDLVDRYAVYKYEREAQRAQDKGDLDTAREKLGAATRQLHKIGEEDLAHEMEGQLAELGDAISNPSRIKRIKATTRRLGSVPLVETHAE
ncbi:MAG: vWA domain-containing protein [Janthinobacterium lividum]